MTDDNKQSIGNKSIKKWLLIGAIIVITILILYFTLTDAPDSANKTSQNESTYSWWNLLLILAGVALLSVLYLAVINKLSEAYHSLTTKYTEFMDQITLSEVMISLIIIPLAVFALSAVIVGLSYNCCGWWDILFTRLAHPAEQLNLRYILIGIIGVATLIFTGWRAHIADQQKEDQVRRTNIEISRRLSERFDGAVAALIKDLTDSSFPSHSGAISGLQALAIDSPEHTQRCLDTICSFNEWMKEYVDEFTSAGSHDPYSSRLLKEDSRIANKNNGGKITLLDERRSQKALVAVSYILEKIYAKRPEQLQKLEFYNKMLCGISLRDLILDGITFQNTYLTAASLGRTSLKQAKLYGTNLQGATLWDAHLEGATLDGVNLEGASLASVHLEGANLRDLHLEGVNLKNLHLKGANLWDVHLEGATLEGVNLEGASLANVHLEGANLRGAHLEDTNLKDAHLEGSFLEGAYLEGSFLEGAHLEGASLKDAHLGGAQLINTQLQGATMDNVDLSNAILLSCNLYGVILNNIKDENIVFNEIADIGYIKDKKKRREWLNDICQHMEGNKINSFRQLMEAAWQVMEKKEEPDGLDIIEKNSIVNRDDPDMYDISEENLANLQNRWQNMFDEKGIGLLYSINNALISLRLLSRTDENKNANLVNKLLALIQQLIESNKTQNKK